MKNSFTRRALALLLAAPALSPLAKANKVRRRPTSVQEMWARTELYFGTDRPGGAVSEAEFIQFIDYEVTPKFPDGLTLLTGYGQFKNSSGVIVKERSNVLILFYPVQTEDANKLIQEIREAYIKAFQQESVLRVDSFAMVSF